MVRQLHGTLQAHPCLCLADRRGVHGSPRNPLHARPLHPRQIDGAAQRGLVSRFQLRGYHGVFHLNGSETRAFCEGRDGNACEGKQISHKKVGATLSCRSLRGVSNSAQLACRGCAGALV